MTPRLCYPTDVPRGARLVDYDLVVADVAVWNDGQLVALRRVLVDRDLDGRVEQDRPHLGVADRQARLSNARWLLGEISS